MILLHHQGGNTSHQAITEAPASRIIPKPVPESHAQDPRKYQLEQLQRRYNPTISTHLDGSTSVIFRLKPSDPDFPFELDFLDCDVRVPAAYPAVGAAPMLHVRNKNIPRGFSINVERGWDRLVTEKKGTTTLLALTYALDKNLENFLSEQKVETVKLVSFRDAKDTRHLDIAQVGTTSVSTSASPIEGGVAPEAMAKPTPRQYVPEPSYTKEEMSEAKARRAQETRQLETRMGRLPLYRKSLDGIVYTLPIEPRRRSELPIGLQAVRTLHLIIPLLYPLQPLRIQLNEVEPGVAEPLEELFVQHTTGQKQMSLTSHINYLAQNMHTMAKTALTEVKAAQLAEVAAQENAPQEGKGKALADSVFGRQDDKRKHIKVIPRPPEWTILEADGEHGTSSDSYDSGDESEDGGVDLGGTTEPTVSMAVPTPERGTSLSFPSVELHGIELLHISILAVSVRCERCKTINEVPSLQPEVEKMSTCRKCAASFAIRFRPQLVHQNSARAGFLDLSGCLVADLLPSTFVPVCAKCSNPSPGLVSVRGETTTNVCRECHGKFTFKIPDVKFLTITPGSLPPPTTGPRKKQQKLGLHAGEPLPRRGVCEHYGKSYRWFRFSCCARVHPCDRCHDAAEDHINEWANRMICGWCSREQNYAVEACAFCGRSVIGRKGRGFWEGGKGTRDRLLMRRNDKRKFRRVGGGEAKSAKEKV